MRAARNELEALAASDALAQANMVHYLVAYSRLLTGRLPDDLGEEGCAISAGFRTPDGVSSLLGQAVGIDGRDCIRVAFDVNDARGEPVAIEVFRHVDGHVRFHGSCELWSPVRGRALIVPNGRSGAEGHLAARAGHPLRWIEGPVAGDLQAGRLRSARRLRDLLDEAVRDKVHLLGQATIIKSIDGELVERGLRRPS